MEATATPEKFPNRTLEMVMCNITHCPDTRGYFQLQMLMLRGNALRDIDALACCTRLRMLDVSFNLLETVGQIPLNFKVAGHNPLDLT